MGLAASQAHFFKQSIRVLINIALSRKFAGAHFLLVRTLSNNSPTQQIKKLA